MGILDRWLKGFLDAKDDAPPQGSPPAGGAGSADRGDADPDAARAAPLPPLVRPTAVTGSAGSSRLGAEPPREPEGAPPGRDPLEDTLRRARARLTLDTQGRAFAEGPDLQMELSSLDAGGRSKAADALLADALLASPSLELRRQLAERLLRRGDRARAATLLKKLAEPSVPQEHAACALLALGEIAEADGDLDEARLRYEQVLAQDIGATQAKTRARRLRRDEDLQRGDDGRRVLARFLGARAAGSRYAVVDEVGRGGAATVFRARDRLIGREVALKIFHARGSAEERRARIVHEARIAGSFEHPHIVSILDLDESRDLLVMALCEGGSLQRRLQQETKLRHTEAVDLGAVLLRTLGDIHEAGHLHLDIKPSNLLFHDGQLMLCDFGTAGMKELGALAGTRAYMAPEHRLMGTADARADLYMAGLVIAESIEGRLPPFGSAPTLSSLPAGPRRRALEAVLATLCARDPRDRTVSGKQGADQLLVAGALPQSDAEGAALYHHVESLAARAGAEATARLAASAMVQALRPPS